MRRLRDLALRDLLERVDSLALGVERVHEMHLGLVGFDWFRALLVWQVS